ncbi:hypothetical protein E6Q11_06505 [Candidatus Dojkabacteria bacterium]|uniref:Uncharacterized protein n=1 Tax=Candidatus Dojkabacteria bacterium TaxID=2099670 RepID=A0A5C7J2T2_9BACT|nr:MAG: hypothetical protein E6Q11_06505 [Candidatus Dojkabacteria bacterium]
MMKSIELDLPNFHDLSLSVIEDEFSIAQRKWGVNLNEEQRSLVAEKSLDQLQKKVNLFTTRDWTPSDSVVALSFKVIQKDNASDNVADSNQADESDSELRLIRVNSGWVTSEDKEQGTALSDMEKEFQEQVYEWLRTAVFYGVASYKETLV